MNSLQSPRGTHDLLPENSPRWRFIENTFRDICARYHYGEIRTPIFEATELFDRSAGDSSDLVVTKQMYSFTALDGESYSLRPEGTAGVVRAYVQHHLNERGPVCKLYYLNSHFRYEAPQAGRYRQHHQCGIEMFGADVPESDAEVLALAHDFFGALGLETLVKINSLGTPESRAGYVETLRKYLQPYADRLSDDSKKRLAINPLRVFDSKDPRDQEIVKAAPRLLDYLEAHDADSMAHFRRVLELLDELQIAYQIDADLVRGLDYYTRTAFEWTVPKLDMSIGGGGRYNGLVEQLGGPPTPGIGFGIGLERLILALGEQVPNASQLSGFLVMLGDEARAAGPQILHRLRQSGLRVDCDYAGRSMKAQMREANRQNAQFALILGETELAANALAVKNMETGDQQVLAINDAIAQLQNADADNTVARYFSDQK